MRVPREVERLFKEGESLSADDAEALERGVEQRSDDVDARVRLLAYHRARAREAARAGTPEERFARTAASVARGGWGSPLEPDQARHALWLAANAPLAPVHHLCHFTMGEPVYAELSSIWRRHAAADPPDSTLLAHAIAFFWGPNDVFADELLVRAEQTFPGDLRWVRFRQARRAHALWEEHRFQPLRDAGLILRSAADLDGSKDERAKKRLAEVERLLREGGPQAEWAPSLREVACELALSIGRIDDARSHAEQLLVVNVGEPEDKPTDNVHNGHLLLGRVALHEGDVDRSKAHLVLAGRAGATGMVPIFGPDMRLAKDLLVRGERDVVIRYLTLCRAFWERGPVDEWIDQIRAGGFPDFGSNLKP